MSGNSLKHRIVVSSRLVSPISCCRNFDARAIAFKQSINGSLSSGRLNAAVATKALGGLVLKKQDPGNTDGRKREFTAESIPGVEKNELGYRWRPDAKWEPGSRLVLSPSFESTRGLDNRPNFGWIKEEDDAPKTFEGRLRRIKEKPQVQVSKVRVNQRTGEADPETQKIMDPFVMLTGMTMDERRKKLSKAAQYDEKSLGRKLRDIVPGGSLIARAAAAIGILVDENNKFRCPPGTPAANQFTDALGSTCFGFSPNRFIRYTQQQSAAMAAQGEMLGFRRRSRRLIDFIRNGRWFEDEAGGEIARIGRAGFYDAATGERIETPDWRDAELPDNMRATQNGMVNAQAVLAREDAQLLEIMQELGVDTSDLAKADNSDIYGAIKVLNDRARAGDPSGWDVQIVDRDMQAVQPKTVEQVEALVRARLEAVQNWGRLTKEEQELLVKADIARYRETERAIIGYYLIQQKKNPASAKFLGQIIFDSSTTHEAATGFYREQPRIVEFPDPVTGEIRRRRASGDMRASVDINMDMIMANQESMLPGLTPDERLSLAAVGGATDAERKTVLANFMLNSQAHARHLAGLVDGPRSFARHIAAHEYTHVLEGKVFLNAIEQRINAGTMEIPRFDKRGNFLGMQKIENIEQISSQDLMTIMSSMGDGIDMANLGNVTQRLGEIGTFAGAYAQEYKDLGKEGSDLYALEALAELWALRDMGLIHGEDVDDLLSMFDDTLARDAESAAARARAATGEMDDTASGPGDTSMARDMTPEQLDAEADEAIRRRNSERKEILESFSESYSELTQEEMFESAALISAGLRLAYREMDIASNAKVDENLTGDALDAAKRNIAARIEMAQDDVDLHNRLYADARKLWRRKYGINAAGELEEFDRRVTNKKNEIGLVNPEDAAAAVRLDELEKLKNSVNTMSDKKIIRTLADRQILMRAESSNQDNVIKMAEEFDAIKNAYIDKLRTAGDARSRIRIAKEIDEKIEALVSPKPKPAKKFKSKAEAETYGKKRRAAQSRKFSKEERRAIKEIGEFDGAELNNILSPDKQVRTGRAINARAARLKKNGLPIDEHSSAEAPLEKQVENILIPAMEAIDKTSISEPIEIEAVVAVDSKKTSGRSIGKEVEIENFVTGKLMPRGTKPTKPTRAEERSAAEGKRNRRVIISLRDGDRGLFTKPGEDGREQVVIPPGALRITGRDEDGTLRMEVASQKDAVAVAGGLKESIGVGEDDAIWRKGAKRRVGEVVDKYVSEKLSRGDRTGPRSDDEKKIAETNAEINKEAIDAGSSFGEGVDDAPDTLASGATAEAIRSADTPEQRWRRILDSSVDPTTRADVRKTGRKSFDGKDIYEAESLESALDLMADGHHVDFSDDSQIVSVVEDLAEFGKWAKANDIKQPAFNLCQIYKSGTNLFCEKHHGIARVEMPQIAGTVTGGNSAAIKFWKAGLIGGSARDAYNKNTPNPTLSKEQYVALAERYYPNSHDPLSPRELEEFFRHTDATKVEPDLTAQFIDFLGTIGIGVSEPTEVNPRTLRATQRELQGTKVAGLSRAIEGYSEQLARGELTQEEFDRVPLNAPILVSRDGYILDGHHRVFGKISENLSRGSQEQLMQRVRFVDATITELLDVSRVFQDFSGIAAASADPNAPGAYKDTNIGSVDSATPEELAQHMSTFLREHRNLIEALDRTTFFKPDSPAFSDSGVRSENPRGRWGLGEAAAVSAASAGRSTAASEISSSMRNAARLASGSIYSPKGTRQSRTEIRRAAIRSNVSELKKILRGKGSKDFPEISIDSIDPRVAEIIMNSTDEQINNIIENAAYAFHAGLDRRVRVRMREAEIDELISTGKVRSPLAAKPTPEEPTRRAKRLSNRDTGLFTAAPVTSAGTGQDLDAMERRTTAVRRLSSGRSGNETLPNGSLNEKYDEINATAKPDSQLERDSADYSVPVFTINGEKITFGADTENLTLDEEVRNIPINPYEASGLSPYSPEGQQAAVTWYSAIVGHDAEVERTRKQGEAQAESLSAAYVTALTYAASRGDDTARQRLAALFADGRQILQQQRAADVETTTRVSDATKEKLNKSGLGSISPRNLVVVHQTTHPIQVDDNGDAILKPTGEFEIFDETGQPYENYRGTIHFAVNHLAKGHDQRGRPEKSQIIMVNLQDAIDANPDALDNLSNVDTWFSTVPGSGLRLPRGSFRIVETQDSRNQDALITRPLKELGAIKQFSGGESGEDPELHAAAVKMVARSLRVPSTVHFGQAQFQAERTNTKRKNPFIMAPISRNSQMWSGLGNRWRASKIKWRSNV